VSVAAVHQPELISDDPRCEASTAEILGEWKRFRDLSKEHGGLLTSGQAARLLGVSPGQVGSWILRGRFTSFKVLGARMVPAPEVIALLKERQEEDPHLGGRGQKAPSLAELARAMWDDLNPGGI
jgi:hypothetical protein